MRASQQLFIHEDAIQHQHLVFSSGVAQLSEFNQCHGALCAQLEPFTCVQTCGFDLNTAGHCSIQLSLWDCAGRVWRALSEAGSGGQQCLDRRYRSLHSEGCWWEMPADREDEICGKALELLSDLCSRGEVQDKTCLDFTYYFRDLGRPRYSDSGKEIVLFLSLN